MFLFEHSDDDAADGSMPSSRCGERAGVFAAEVLLYAPDFSGFPPTHPDVLDPEDALGPPDYTSEAGYPGLGSVSLGQGGRLELSFGDCWLGNDLAANPDLRIFEVGPAVEGLSVALRARPESAERVDPARRLPGEDPWFHVAEIGGGVTELDLESLSEGGVVFFDAVRFDDDPTQGTGTELAWGADIDAVELLTWADR